HSLRSQPADKLACICHNLMAASWPLGRPIATAGATDLLWVGHRHAPPSVRSGSQDQVAVAGLLKSETAGRDAEALSPSPDSARPLIVRRLLAVPPSAIPSPHKKSAEQHAYRATRS